MRARFESVYSWDDYGRLAIDHADIFWTNFKGEEKIDKATGRVVNEKGTKNFNVYIYNVELAEEMRDEGWNVKIYTRDGEEPIYYIPVEVRWRDKSGELLNDGLIPQVFLECNDETPLTEDTIKVLDGSFISDAGLTIRKRRYQNRNGDWVIKAFLAEGWFVIKESNRGNTYRQKKENDTAGGKFKWDVDIEDEVIDIIEDLEEKISDFQYEGGHEAEIGDITDLIDILSKVYGLYKG